MNEDKSVFGKSNLIKAYELVRDEFQRTDYPLDPIYFPIIYVINQHKEDFFNKLSVCLKSGSLEADRAYYLQIPKNEVRYRKICVLSLIDRVVYQAIMNSGFLGSLYNSSLNKGICFNPKVTDFGGHYFTQYQEDYDKFIKSQVVAYDNGYKWQIFFDLERFFDTIPQKKLINKIRSQSQNLDERMMQALECMLQVWDDSGIGIPQGPFASQTLSNFYLLDIDSYAHNLMKKFDFKLARYQDDYSLMAKDESTAKLIFEELAVKIMDLGLNLNYKTSISCLNNAEDLKDKMICPSENDVPEETTFVKLVKYRKEIPGIVKRLQLRERTTENDLRYLKYCLKVLLPFRESHIGDLLDIIDKVPNFVVYIIRYIEFNLKFNPKSYINLDDRLKIVLLKNHLPWWGRLWLYKAILTYKYPKNKELVIDLIEKELATNWLIDLIKYQEKDLSNIDTTDFTNEINPYIIQIYGFRLFKEEDLSIYEDLICRAFSIANKDLQVVYYFLCEKGSISMPNYKLPIINALAGEEVKIEGRQTQQHILNVDVVNATEVHVGKFYGTNKDPAKFLVDERFKTYSQVLGKNLNPPHLIINNKKSEVCLIFDQIKVVPFEKVNMNSEWVTLLKLYSNVPKATTIGPPAQVSKKVPKKDKFARDIVSNHRKRFLNLKDKINTKFHVDSDFQLFSLNINHDWVCNATVTEIS